MVELIYPVEQAPVIAGDRGNGSVEMLPVVEQSGLVIGQASRQKCHSRGLLHPVVHLHILDRMGRLFIQHRSASKDLFPGRWDTAVGGHVSYGEQYIEALFREAGEELGFFDFNPIYIKTYLHECDNDRELANVYAAVGNFDLHPDNEEVSEGKFWTQEEIAAAMGKKIFTPNFEEEYLDVRDSLMALL